MRFTLILQNKEQVKCFPFFVCYNSTKKGGVHNGKCSKSYSG